jgi:hypothetical protein
LFKTAQIQINRKIGHINQKAKRQVSNMISLREAVEKKKSDLYYQ